MDTSLRKQIIQLYRQRAGNYDFTANLYYLIGYPEWKYRRIAVDALGLKPGNTVIEIACGTGLNFELYQKAIGPTGKIIGVDLTDAMLGQAKQRIEKHAWENVELVHSDALAYPFPTGVDGIISTYALSLIPEAPVILERAIQALKPGGRLSLIELQIPDDWPQWMTAVGLWLTGPFAITDEWLAHRPWKDIRQKIQSGLDDIQIEEKYLRTTYIISGKKSN